jgi:acetyl-CoA synthetase
MGVTSVIDAGPFDAARWLHILASQGVTVWYTSPSAIRRLMRLSPEEVRRQDAGRLRHILSVGEPLPPDAVRWGREVLGRTISDTWWQTETGGIMIANRPSMPVRPGSMGKPISGVTAVILRRTGPGTVAVIEEPDTVGELGLAAGWPSMFRGYLGEPERYARCFSGGWYLSGDLARRDADGYFWFVGRGDDIIKTSGQMVGPFEVECLLLSHPMVADAGVIGKPDPMMGEVVKAFVVTKPGIRPDDDARRELIAFTRKSLGAAIAPREIEFTDVIPKNRAGKVMRRLLKARELGEPPGDISTLEEG